jgi:inorganic pyrophosphatase
MTAPATATILAQTTCPEPPIELEVVIEVPRGSFLKRSLSGSIDFVSPLPSPFNFGAVPTWLGLEGDLLDALVLGPRGPLVPAGACGPGVPSR